ncbi:MAG: tyrosine decarboxylase MfnA, partial [Methanomicrobiales archaeon]|nr:tyrosine decarboxylase MfnA [Methanomicrobiales archaeon]
MREIGCSEAEILTFLARQQGEDLPFERILSSMCTRPHPVAVKAHMLFIHTNLGDPGLYKGTAALERMLIERIGDLLHFRDACGYATSGGTESNIQALRIAQRVKKVKKPNVIVPESVHFSFEKACEMLCIEMREIPLDAGFRADAAAIPSLIDRNTIALVAVAGTTEYGVVDPIPEMDAIAGEHDLYFHVDAAFGGLVLPFLEDHTPFDFSLPNVSSMSVDPHKMGMSTIPTGCLLIREPRHLSLLNICTPYLSVKQEFTLTGTRPGGSVAGALAVLDHLGRQGMRAIVQGCMKNTRRLIAGMRTYGYPAAVMPEVNVATFFCRNAPADWQVSRT